MVSPNVNKILEAAQALNDAEREELRRLLDDRAARQSGQTKEEQLQQLLLDEGIISHVPLQPTDDDIRRFNSWKPIPIQGKPLSETIVEDRV